jgi:hypothetical protein
MNVLLSSSGLKFVGLGTDLFVFFSIRYLMMLSVLELTALNGRMVGE